MTAKLLPSSADTVAPSPLVQTSSGGVIGTAQRGVRAFKGIPFAQAERFRRATAVPNWETPLRCTAFGPVAPQRGLIAGNAEAECLTLNIWTPAEVTKPLPVLFFIHGGAFITGAGSDYDGAFLAKHGPAVIVTINYRLGPLGFLQLHPFGGVLAEANNLAVTDTLAALIWVRDNIAAFGGDPDNVTLLGQSAGASLVVTMMTLPQARGHFRRSVAFSVPGRGIMPAAQADDIADRFLAALELAPHDAAAIRDVPVARLLDTAETVGREVASRTAHGTLFGPVLDGVVIPRDPRDAISAGALREQNLWLGSCRDEMVMFLKSDPPAAMIRVTEGRIRAQFGDDGWDRLLASYRATARADEDPYEALSSDAMWHRPMGELAELHHEAGGRVWLSRFDHRPALAPFLSQGPTHGADNACLWAHLPDFVDRPVLQRPGGPMTLADIEVAARLQACVLRFAEQGRPDDESIWPAFTPAEAQFAIFASPFRVNGATNAPRQEAWRSLGADQASD
ncbi:carboxylesterase/lipase family protein [Bradyrhizobium sp. HKCCYLS1011]|uniref:carboxylesterase/lipase family protein n=1 Tax=Bradyrhizobium sp. HKCCYLS1011 TaxID=3420733 RepID=UPI003EBBF01B